MGGAAALWRNWSGSIAFRPRRQVHPRDIDEVQSLVRATAARGGTLRVVGAGHSSNDILRGEDTLLVTDQLSGVISADRAHCTAVVRPGTQLQELGRSLYEHDLALLQREFSRVCQLWRPGHFDLPRMAVLLQGFCS